MLHHLYLLSKSFLIELFFSMLKSSNQYFLVYMLYPTPSESLPDCGMSIKKDQEIV